MIKIKTKIVNFFSNLKDDFDFWKRKDVSLRFKILNMLSGDRLRIGVAFPAMCIRGLQTDYAELFSDKYNIDWDNPSKTDLQIIAGHYRNMEWRINDISNDLNDLFEI